MILIGALLILLLQSIAYGQQTIKAIRWGEDTVHIRLYYYQGGYIKEKAKDGDGSWYTGSFKKRGNTVGATVYQDDGLKIRVYVGYNNNIQEYIYDQGWKTGSFKEKGRAADAVSWVTDNDLLHLRIYVVKSNYDIIQYSYDESNIKTAAAEGEEEFEEEDIT